MPNMKSYKFVSVALCALALSSCAQKAQIRGTVDGAPESRIVVKQLNVNTYNVLDTVKTKSDGSFAYKLDVAEGQPEFIYLFRGETMLAALLLEKGDKVDVQADTLGNYSVSGSEECSKLQEVQKAYATFVKGMASSEDPSELGRIYVSHYRECVKYLMSNPFSMTTIPVLYEAVNNLPVFAQTTDAIHFRNAADSLKKVYPESRYVKALAKDAEKREATLKLQSLLRTTPQTSFPEVNSPDMLGRKVALSSLDAKVILLHFWDASVAGQKMLNLEVLKPLYEEFHSKGLEIYSVCLDADKVEWASVVKAQELPWINVNDGLGVASPVVTLYNVAQTPSTFIISGGEIVTESASGTDDFRSLLRSLLK